VVEWRWSRGVDALYRWKHAPSKGLHASAELVLYAVCDVKPHTMSIVARARCLVARGVRGVLWRRTAPLDVVVAPKRVVR
jgi:hypothetical protein